jgi:hypothetical protein
MNKWQDGLKHLTTWQQEQLLLEEQYVKRLLIDYGIREVTTQRQAKNETREFEFPVPSFSRQRLKYYTRKSNPLCNVKDLPRLRIACFKSGYVRKQNGADRAYQLNPTYEQNYRCVWQRQNGEIYISKGMTKARALILSPITRLNFMLNYYLKNYANN